MGARYEGADRATLKGIYLLIMRLDAELADLAIGRLGRYDFAAGYYLYVGSAFGSGGIAARLAHHERADKPRPHWHIDYLRARVALVESWGIVTAARLESCWARRLAELPDMRIPVAGFGASDSDFTSHLLYASRRPPRERIAAALMDCFLSSDSAEFRLELRDY